MRANEFITEAKLVDYEGITLKVTKNDYELMVDALDDWGNKVLGHVTFYLGDDNELDPQDLWVNEKYQGQGIAKTMYDYVKKLGYKIVRSYDQTDAGAGFWDKHRGDVRVWEDVPQPGESSGAPKQFRPDAKIQTRQMTVRQIISSIPGLPYYNNVVDDWDAKDYSWGVTKKVIEYATYLKEHPESLSQLPPILVLNGKFEDGAHRVSAIWLLQQRMDPKNPLWANAKLNVQFIKQGVAEEDKKKQDPIASTIIDFYQNIGDIEKQPVDNYVSTAKEMLGQVDDPKLKSKLLNIFKKAKENPYVQGGVVTTIGALLAGGVLSSAQKMGLNPAQTNLALQAILNTVIPTVVSRINGKSWSDTIKYTLASAGIGTGIAGIMEDNLDSI